MNNDPRSEIERLRDDLTREQGGRLTDNMTPAKQIVDLEVEIERLRGIVQFSETASQQQREGLQAEVERLKAALREIADHKTASLGIINVARAALEGK